MDQFNKKIYVDILYTYFGKNKGGFITMKKIILVILALITFTFLLSACGKKDPIQTDLLNYANNQLPTLTSLNGKLTQDFAAVPFDNDQTFMTKVKANIIPASDQLISKAKAIVPTTPEVLKIHNQYIELLNVQGEAYAMYLKSFQDKNTDLMTSATAKLTSVGDLSDKFLSDLKALEKEHNIETKE